MQEHFTHFSDLCTGMEQRFSKQDTEHGVQLAELTRFSKETESRFSTLCQAMDDKYTNKNTIQDERMEGINAHLTGLIESMGTKWDENHNALEGRLESTVSLFGQECANLDAKHEGKAKDLSERLQKQHRHFTCDSPCPPPSSLRWILGTGCFRVKVSFSPLNLRFRGC